MAAAKPVSFSVGKDSSFMALADLDSIEKAFEHYEEFQPINEPPKLSFWPLIQYKLTPIFEGLEGLPKDLIVNTEKHVRYRIPAHKNAVDYRLRKLGFKSTGGLGSQDSKGRGTFIYDYGCIKLRGQTVEIRLIKNNEERGKRRLFLDIYRSDE